MAQSIANAALAQWESMGYRVSVTVLDREGLPIVMSRGDGAGLHTPEGSDRKAYTARVQFALGCMCQTNARQSGLRRFAAICPCTCAWRRIADQSWQ
jgi:uncharacterized protein GlcG (DUF336 family)